MRLARRFEHLALSIFVVFTQASCFKKLGEDRKPDPTGDNSFTAFYMGRDSSFIAATAKCQTDSTVQFRYSSDRYGERHDVNEECPDSGLVETKLRVPKGDVNQLISIQVRNRIKNILSVADEETLRWSPNVTGFVVTGITGADDSNSDVWLVKSNRVPKVNFSNSQDATGYKLSIKDAAGATEICPEVTLDASASSHEFIGCTLDPATQYQAVLTAVNSNIETNAAAYTFTVDDTDPNLGAIDGVTGVRDDTVDTCLGEGRNPTLHWSGFTNSNDYEVRITDALGDEKCREITSDVFLQVSDCSLDDGSYRAYVTARSASSYNTVTTPSFSFDVDTEAPAAPAVGINSLSNQTNNTTPQWIWLPVGGDYRYKLDDSNLDTGATSTGVASHTPASALDEGYYILYVQQKDACGNWSESGSAGVYIDTTPPDAPIVTTSGTNPTSVLRPQWTWTSGTNAGDGTFEAELDGNPVTPGDHEYTSGSDLALGSHLLKVRERDAAGNWSDWGEYTIIINNPGDPCPPDVSITPAITNNPRPQWTWTAQRASGCNGSSAFQVSFDNVNFTDVAASLDFTPGSDLPDGQHTLYVQESNGAGGWSLSGSATVTIDTTPPPPNVGWVRPKAGGQTVATNFFPFVWKENTSARSYYVEGFDNADCSGAPAVTATTSYITYPFENLQNGNSYSIKVYAQDLAGNRSAASTCSPSVIVDASLAKTVTDVSIGKDHICALESGDVYCWGKNDAVQLGTIKGASSIPRKVSNLTGVTKIASGPYSGYAITNSGALKSWGLESLVSQDKQLIREKMPSAFNVTDVDGGYEHTCAVANGAVLCWGKNTYGNLGNNSTTDSDAFVGVNGLTAGSSTMVRAGNFHTCALANGGVKCWGRNNEGQLGDGTKIDRYTPVDVVGLTSNVVAIEAADGISCAILNTGELRCWGKVVYGGSFKTHLTPFPMPGFATGTTAVTGASVTGCGIKDGTTYCVGYNASGQAGIYGPTSYFHIAQVAGLPANAVSKVVAGYDDSCAIVANGLTCWGKFYEDTVGATEKNSMPVVVDWAGSPPINIIFSDNFNRANSTTIGNFWNEHTNVNEGDALIDSNALYFNVSSGNISPVVAVAFAPQTTPFSVEFDFNFQRDGSDSTYAVYMQLGDAISMSLSDIKSGVGPNLKWAGKNGTQSLGGMDTHEGFGFEQGANTFQITTVSTLTHVSLWIDPANLQYRVLVGDYYSSAYFEKSIGTINEIRFLTNNLGTSSFNNKKIDNVLIYTE